MFIAFMLLYAILMYCTLDVLYTKIRLSPEVKTSLPTWKECIRKMFVEVSMVNRQLAAAKGTLS